MITRKPTRIDSGTAPQSTKMANNYWNVPLYLSAITTKIKNGSIKFYCLIVRDVNIEHETTLGPRDRLPEQVRHFQVDVADVLGVLEVLDDDRVVSEVAQIEDGVRGDGDDDALFLELVRAVQTGNARVFLLLAYDRAQAASVDIEQQGEVRGTRGIDQVRDPDAFDFDANGRGYLVGQQVSKLDFTASIRAQIDRHLHFRPAHPLQRVLHRHPLDGRQSLVQHFHRHLWC